MVYRMISAFAYFLGKIGGMSRVIAVSEKGWPMGEDCPRTRWSAAQVERVRALAASGVGIRAAAAAVGVPYETARAYVYGRRRGEIPARWVVRPAQPVRVGGRRDA